MRRPAFRSTGRTIYRRLSLLSGAGRATSRRPSTSAHWRLQYKHLTTLFYSSIIATAAAADAEAKRRRRERWVLAIEEVQRGLEEVRERTSALDSCHEELIDVGQDHPAALESPSNAGGLEEWIRLRTATVAPDIFGSPFDLGHRLHDAEASYKHADDGIFPAARRVESSIFKPRIVETSRISPTSIYASSFRRAKLQRRLSSKKILTLELSVAKLTTRFLLYAARRSRDTLHPTQDHTGGDRKEGMFKEDGLSRQPSPPAVARTNSPPIESNLQNSAQPAGQGHISSDSREFDSASYIVMEDRLQQIIEQLEKVKHIDADNTVGLESVDYPQYGHADDVEGDATHSLNYALLMVLNKYGRGELDTGETLAKISYNLLISRYSPTRISYNILLSHFSRLKQYDLFDMVLESFEESHLRPDEMNVSTILVQYTRRDNFRGFVRYIEKLRGHRRCVMLAHPKTPTEGVGSSRLRRLNDRVFQLMKLDPYTFQCVIHGYLHFNKLDDAMSWYRQMLNENIKPTTFILTGFLRYFSRQSDWDRALGVWKNIEMAISAEHAKVNYDSATDLLPAYTAMLQLCINLEKYEEHDRIYRDAESRGLSPESFEQALRPRGYTTKEDELEYTRRMVRILTYRSELLLDDLRAWAVHVLASKTIIHGFDPANAKAVFDKYSDTRAYEKWIAERPWLEQATFGKVSNRISASERSDEGLFDGEKRYRFDNVELVGQSSANQQESHRSLEKIEETSLPSRPNEQAQPQRAVHDPERGYNKVDERINDVGSNY